jgi:hypothetical protein
MKDTFCATCPVIDKTEKNYIEESAAFTSECGADNICKEDLEVEANFISNLKSVQYFYLVKPFKSLSLFPPESWSLDPKARFHSK